MGEVTTTPNPDPTDRTVSQLLAAVAAERALTDSEFGVIRARLDAIDHSTDTRFDGLVDARAAIINQLTAAQALTLERFTRVEKVLDLIERNRAEQKVDTATALAQALAAAEKALEKQTEAAEKAVAKTEAGTTKAIDQQGQTFSTSIEGLRRELASVKELAQGTAAGYVGRDTGSSRTQAIVFAVAGLIGTAAIIALGVIAAIK